MNKEEFTGEKLKFLRKKYGLKQQEVADNIGSARERISEWENKKYPISKAYQRLLSIYFKNLEEKQ